MVTKLLVVFKDGSEVVVEGVEDYWIEKDKNRLSVKKIEGIISLI